MLRLTILLGFGLALVSPLVLKPMAAHCATCNPSGVCRACSNCKYCKHCSKLGGKCSVCR